MHQLVYSSPAEVKLIASTPDMARVIATVCRSYGHEFTGEPADDEYTATALVELTKTQLHGPLEMGHMLWLITGVTRAFTHQLVRYRIGTSFAQESLRFSPAQNHTVLATTRNPAYAKAVEVAMAAYSELVSHGVANEDARGVLPTNICTAIYFDCSLATLLHVWEQRKCEQAQHGEWGIVLGRMRELITAREPLLRPLFRLPCDGPKGHCAFQSMWDRPCPIREKLAHDR